MPLAPIIPVRPFTSLVRSGSARHRLRSAAIFLLFWIALSRTLAFAATFTAALDRETTTAGEAVNLLLIFEGGTPAILPEIPTVPNLNASYGGQSSSFSFVNGRSSSTITYTYTLASGIPGEYVIPAITAKVGNQTLQSQPLKLKVVKAGDPAAGATNNIAFLRLVLPRETVYVGEAIPVEVQLFAQGGDLKKFPELRGEGFTFSKLIEGDKREQVQANNVLYQRLSFRGAINVIKAGELTLQATDCVLDVAFRKRRGRDPFGFDAFDSFFGGVETRRFTLASEPKTLRSLPLPTQGVPPSFNGAVGTFTMTVSASPTNVAVGDPVTLRIDISGKGGFDALTLPQHAGFGEFKSYPPTSKAETDELGMQGVKHFEQVVVPQNTAVAAVPGLAFSFFDPEQKAYRTVTSSEIPLIVRPSAGVQPPPSIAGGSNPSASPSSQQDIVFIKPSIGPLAQIGPPLIFRPWFVLLQILPLLAWVSAVVWRKRMECLANNPRLRRRRQVAVTVQNGLAQLRELATENRADEFFATVFRLLQEKLGERLDLPSSAITEAVIEERLRPLGVADEKLGTLHKLFQICNQARYAPQRSSQELSMLIPIVEYALGELQSLND
jgi:hypothetical protein